MDRGDERAARTVAESADARLRPHLRPVPRSVRNPAQLKRLLRRLRSHLDQSGDHPVDRGTSARGVGAIQDALSKAERYWRAALTLLAGIFFHPWGAAASQQKVNIILVWLQAIASIITSPKSLFAQIGYRER